MKNLRIVFMGTPDFASEILKHLVENQCNIVGCVTIADKPIGRGQKLQSSSVKRYAQEQGLPIFQPEKLRDSIFLEQMQNLNADVFIVVAFRMLPKILWSMPKLGTFNLHASLLPDYRGAAPINWAIINGEKETGVTTFLIDEKIDTGEILLQEKTPIDEKETAGTLHDKLMIQGSKLVIKTLQMLSSGNIKTITQPKESFKNAFKIYKNTCRINWNQPSKTIDCFIRGLSPYPTAWTMWKDDKQEISIKIYQSTPIEVSHELTPGQIICENKTLKVATTDGFIQIDSLQLPSKKQMSIQSLLNGFEFSIQGKFI